MVADITRSKRISRAIYEWLDALVFALVAVVVLFTFVFKSYMVRGISMEPTLYDGYRVFVYSFMYTPSQGDIIVMDESLEIGDYSIVKRVVAVENQTVDIDPDTGEITVDGVVFDTPISTSHTNNAGDMDFPGVVPEGYIFVMGDNREHSLDSRYQRIGFIDKRNIIGKAIYIISPVEKAGKL